jgi:hypothetical protein
MVRPMHEAVEDLKKKKRTGTGSTHGSKWPYKPCGQDASDLTYYAPYLLDQMGMEH